MVGVAGFEPATPSSRTTRCSNVFCQDIGNPVLATLLVVGRVRHGRGGIVGNFTAALSRRTGPIILACEG